MVSGVVSVVGWSNLKTLSPNTLPFEDLTITISLVEKYEGILASWKKKTIFAFVKDQYSGQSLKIGLKIITKIHV